LNFADASRALVPMLDGAAVPWDDESQYDNWARIAEALYETLVTEPCACAAFGEGNLSKLNVARYGFSPAPGNCNACAGVEGANPKRLGGLSTAKRPFDQVRVAGAEAGETMLLRDCRFVFVFSGPYGTQQRLTDIDLHA
jgi:hypothetical protein